MSFHLRIKLSFRIHQARVLTCKKKKSNCIISNSRNGPLRGPNARPLRGRIFSCFALCLGALNFCFCPIGTLSNFLMASCLIFKPFVSNVDHNVFLGSGCFDIPLLVSFCLPWSLWSPVLSHSLLQSIISLTIFLGHLL